MKSWFKKKLGARIGFYLLLIVILLAILISYYVNRNAGLRYNSELRLHKILGNILIQNADNNIIFGLLSQNQELLSTQAEELVSNPVISYVVIYDKHSGVVVEKYTDHLKPGLFDFASLNKNKENQEIIVREIHSRQGELFLDLHSMLTVEQESFAILDTESSHIGWIRIGMSLETLAGQLTRSRIEGYLLILAVFLLGGAVIAISLYQVIPTINRLVHAAHQFGKGDYEIEVEVKSEDELGLLTTTFNEMVKNIKKQTDSSNEMNENLKMQMQRSKELLSSITEAVELLTDTISNLSTISSQQASGSAEQASSAYEASTTSQEIAASAKNIAETASRVTNIAQQTAQTCEQGRKYLDNAVDGIRNIKEKVELTAKQMIELWDKSEKITGLLDIINEISEQTNLLALNAAIEAVGAGEAGKRFSVVASEVRRLAQRTLDSTKVVHNTIKEIQSATNATVMVSEEGIKAVDEGILAMDDLGNNFKDILEQVITTSSASEEINISTNQQTSACEQMVVSMTGVSDVAKEVENGARGLESATSELNSLAERMKEMVVGGSNMGF